MANPVIHALVIIAAIIIPGGLLVYVGWRASKAKLSRSKKCKKSSLGAARNAFFRMYPKDSLRAKSRKNHLERAKTFRHRNSGK
jgi:hypothetical protein